MKNKILLFLILLSSISFAQVSNGGEQEFDYGIKNNASTEIATPPFLVSQGIDGTYGKMNRNNVIEYLEFASAVNLPVTGEQGKLYLTKDNNRLYRFNGTIYQELTTNISGKEDIANKQNSLAVDGTGVKFPTVDATNAGLSTKATTTGTTGNLQRIVGTNQLGNSALTDNGTTVVSSLPLGISGSITGTSFIKSEATATNILLAGGTDITQASLPVSTATQTALDLKANLASPALTGTPTAPTATAGTNTTQVATTAFVTNGIATANSQNVKLTGNQTVSGIKTFGSTIFSEVIPNYISIPNNQSSISNNGNFGVQITRRNGLISLLSSTSSIKEASLNTSSFTADRAFIFPNQDGTFALTSNPTSLTATSFIKSSAPTTNILLAGGGDIAQNTAFNKNFGTTSGTVVEGGTLGSNAYTSTSYLRLIDNEPLNMNNSNINAAGKVFNGLNTPNGGNFGTVMSYGLGAYSTQFSANQNANAPLYFRVNGDGGLGTWRKLWHDGNFNPANYLPLSGGTLTGAISGTSATFSETVTASPATTNAQVPTLGQVKALVSSGTYTPTLTAVENTSVNSLTYASYTIVGDIVSVQCSANISITAGTTISKFKITLPINSSISATNLYCGQGTLYTSYTVTQSIPSVVYRNGATEAIVLFNSETGFGPREASFSFQYKL